MERCARSRSGRITISAAVSSTDWAVVVKTARCAGRPRRSLALPDELGVTQVAMPLVGPVARSGAGTGGAAVVQSRPLNLNTDTSPRALNRLRGGRLVVAVGGAIGDRSDRPPVEGAGRLGVLRGWGRCWVEVECREGCFVQGVEGGIQIRQPKSVHRGRLALPRAAFASPRLACQAANRSCSVAVRRVSTLTSSRIERTRARAGRICSCAARDLTVMAPSQRHTWPALLHRALRQQPCCTGQACSDSDMETAARLAGVTPRRHGRTCRERPLGR